MPILKACLLVIYSLTGFLSLNVKADLRFEHLGREDGLSQSFVNSIVQDEHGYIWLGTQSGLNKFDGYEVTQYFNEPSDATSLGENSIRALLLSQNNELWIGADSGRLSVYEEQSQTFENFTLPNQTVETTPSPHDVSHHIRVIFEDSNNVLWIGTEASGIYCFDLKTRQFLSPIQQQVLSGGSSIRAIVQDDAQHLIIATQNGAFRVNTSKGTIFPIHLAAATTQKKLTQREITALLRRSDGSIYFGLNNGALHLLKTGENHTSFLTTTYTSEAKRITSLLLDNEEQLWIGSLDGLIRFDGEKVKQVKQNINKQYALAHNTVITMFKDRTGVLWAGTYKGASRWCQSSIMLNHHKADTNLNAGLRNNMVSSFAENQQGDIWVGTFGGGLDLFRKATKHFSQFDLNATLPNSGPNIDNKITSLLNDKSARLWIGTRSEGITILDKDRHFIKKLDTQSAQSPLSSNLITAIVETKDGYIWAATYNGGLNRIDPTSFEVRQFTHTDSEINSLGSNSILALMEDRFGDLWIGTKDGGLNRYITLEDEFRHYKFDPDSLSSLSGNTVISIAEDKLGNLWLGTQSDGINIWFASHRVAGIANFTRLSTNNGLLSNDIYGIQATNDGHVWISSNAGLSKLNIESFETNHFDLSQGLQDLEFNHGASFKASDGSIYFGGINGFNIVKKDERINTPSLVSPTVTGISILNKPVQQLSTILSQGLVLNYNDYMLEFKFSALEYNPTSTKLFQYQLEGFDKGWVNAKTKRHASYTNLHEGTYNFKLKASSDGVNWLQAENPLVIQVQPAPWRSWWAISIYLSVISIILYLLFRDLKQREQHTKEVLKINHNLELEVTAGKEKEAALEYEKEQNKHYFDIADVLLIVINKDGIVTRINQKTEQTIAKPSSVIVGKTWEALIADDHQSRMRSQIDACFDQKPSTTDFHFECSIENEAHTKPRVMWRFALLSQLNKHNSPTNSKTQLLISGMDVTAIRNMEKTIRLQEKLTAVGTMASGIAHDFNNILTAISGYTMLAQDPGHLRNQLPTYLEKIASATDRASNLISRLPTFSQDTERQLEPHDLYPTMLEAITHLEAVLPKTVKVSANITTVSELVNSDPTQIHQILMNLGTNAGKALHKHQGQIDISTSYIYLEEQDIPHISKLKLGKHLLLQFKDNGVGMTEHTMQHIFDPFFTTQDTGYGAEKGTGLGMSVVHDIVSSHKGHIAISSTIDRGTEFKIWLPCFIAQDYANKREKTVHLQTPHGKMPCILIVDDEAWVVEVAELMLKSIGYRTVSFTTPLAAEAYFHQHNDEIDLLLTDYNMPDINGLMLLSKLRAINPTLAAIVISGNKPSLVAAGNNTTFCPKPFTLASLQQQLDTHLSKPVDPNNAHDEPA